MIDCGKALAQLCLLALTQRASLSPAAAVYCWGSNDVGQCGTGGTNAELAAPTLFLAPNEWTLFHQVQAGNRFTCAVTSDGEMYCFGGAPEASGGEGFFGAARSGLGGLPLSGPRCGSRLQPPTLMIMLISHVHCAVPAVDSQHVWAAGGWHL